MQSTNSIWRPYDNITGVGLLTTLVDNANFKMLRLDTFKHVTDPKLKGMIHHIGKAIGAVAYLSDFTEKHNVYDFPLNNDGLIYIEQYLTRMVKPYITKWGGKYGLVPKIQKAKSLMPNPESSIESRIFLASRVLGQCLAQQHNLFWTPDGEALMLDPLKPQRDIEVRAKILKFMKYGKEDGLGGYSIAIANMECNFTLLNNALKQLKEIEGITFPQGCIYQQWTNVEGRLEHVVVKDPTGKKILKVLKFADEKELRAANPKNVQELLNVGKLTIH